MDVADIIDRLNAMGFEDTPDDDKMDVINDTVWDIESRALWPWSIKSTTLTMNGTVAEPTNMPADYKSVKWITDTLTGNTLWYERLDTIRNRYGSQLTLTQDPWCFYFIGEILQLYPTPPTASTTRYIMDYYAQQPELTTTSVEADIYMPPRHHRLILLGAAAKIYQIEDDQELAQSNKQDYEQRLQNTMFDQIKKQHVNPDQIFVIDEDDEWTY